MAAIPKKTATSATNGTTRKGALNTSTTSVDTPSKSPTRAPNAPGATTASVPAINRTRSARNAATSPSARAAARRLAGVTDTAAAEDDEAKAGLQSKIDELQEQLREAETSIEQAQQKAAVLQVKLDEAAKDQGLLEESVHEHLERINDLEVEKKESLRARREMEQIFESERIAVMKEKDEMQAREHELRSSMQRLKETLNQKELRGGARDDENRPGLQRNSSRKSLLPSPGEEMGAQFAPSSLERSDSRSSSKLVMQKDRIIESLRLELAEAQIQLVEAENLGGGQLQKLQKEMYDIKVQNARLMEENDSFQLLLRDKTLNGDFANSELLHPSSISGSSPPGSRQQGGTLADELEATGEQDIPDQERKLQTELNALRDQNKALTLYINNIVSRLLQHDQFEHILDKTPDLFNARATIPPVAQTIQTGDKDKELPPPPPEKDDQPAQGFLSRARSVLGGRPARPMSQIFDTNPVDNSIASPHTDPKTAPQVPLGRTASTRQGHRRANSDWGAASIVNNMYRGPTTSSAIANPASPGLSSPTARAGGFFNAPQPLGPGLPPRIPSGTVSTIPESGVDDEEAKEEPPATHPRDSKLTQNRNSIVSVPDATAGGEALSNPSSPPRTSVSHERDNRLSIIAGQSSAPSVMVGSKMRPLRLVQENAMDEDAMRKGGASANRGSWFGFLNKGV